MILNMYIYEIRPIGTAWGVYFTHPEMLWWTQDKVFEKLCDAKEYISEKRKLQKGEEAE